MANAAAQSSGGASAQAERLPVSALRGVGPKIADRFARLGVETVFDLLVHLPHRYEDRTRITPLSALAPGRAFAVEGVIEAVEVLRGRRSRLVCTLRDPDDDPDDDHDDGTLRLVWLRFHAGQKTALRPGLAVRAHGPVTRYQGILQMVHPEYRLGPFAGPQVAEPRLTPVYPTVQDLGQNVIRGAVGCALDVGGPVDLLAAVAGLPPEHEPLIDSLEGLHRPAPDCGPDAEPWRRRRDRLAVEELLAHHLALRRARRARDRLRAPGIPGGGAREAAVFDALPFTLTAPQARALAAIQSDLGTGRPMQRLLHGDVGCGKTVVAALAAARVVDGGFQVALMAPTEVLAEQHGRTVAPWFEAAGIRSGVLVGARPAAERRRITAAAASGEVDVLIGTHALLQDPVVLPRLGLAVVDEQHRFGVDQRGRLRGRGGDGDHQPHLLSMTATPIPRTLAMTFYADLDLSAIDALPPGRHPARTAVLAARRRAEVIARVGAICAAGAQAFWVCPAIEENEASEGPPLQAVETVGEELAAALPGLRIGVVHGRQRGADRERCLRGFRDAELDVLVATTVIEVGVDVPAASLMVVENAERMGLAQLHQLRGRVGRGGQRGYCLLLYTPPLSPMARARLDALRRLEDGFRIAERDLELRGAGELLGTRQSGSRRMRVADPGTDRDRLPLVAELGERIERDRPDLADALVRRWIPRLRNTENGCND